MNAQVLIDGTDIKELNLPWLRQQMALVSQEPALFRVWPSNGHGECCAEQLSCCHRAWSVWDILA